MDLNLIEEINKLLSEAERETNEIYNKLKLDEKFNEWFKDLDRSKKLDIYKLYQLEELSLDD